MASEPQLPSQDGGYLVNDLVAYLISQHSSLLPVKKIDISKNVLKAQGRNFKELMSSVTAELKDIFGLELVAVDDKSTKFLLINTIQDTNLTFLPYSAKWHRGHILLFILYAILKSGDTITEGELVRFLESCGYIDSDNVHGVSTDVNSLLKILEAQMYIEKSFNAIKKKNVYSWGKRSELEIKSDDLIKYVTEELYTSVMEVDDVEEELTDIL